MGGEEQAVMENVETVEVVASGDDVQIPASSSSAAAAVAAGVGLMDHQHMIVTSPEGILVPTSEVSQEYAWNLNIPKLRLIIECNYE